MLLVAALGLGQLEQDLALLALPAAGEVAVDGGFGALVRQVLAPAFDVGVRRGARDGEGSGVLIG
ncbi:hypothetical protein ACRAWC_03115 [Leifsonia sp. L25]|uniref:hypothetical protein n=1 Tax=Actinomycetes TaxID=1760 RepID=UPI003D69B1E2